VARERFLNPKLLASPSELNTRINFRTEQAILWAMAMHPDERPESITEFLDALLGSGSLESRPRTGQLRTRTPRTVNFYASALQEIFGSKTERTLWAVAGGAMVFSLLLTILF